MGATQYCSGGRNALDSVAKVALSPKGANRRRRAWDKPPTEAALRSLLGCLRQLDPFTSQP
jgi:hypothetical protein